MLNYSLVIPIFFFFVMTLIFLYCTLQTDQTPDRAKVTRYLAGFSAFFCLNNYSSAYKKPCIIIVERNRQDEPGTKDGNRRIKETV